jgi:hypothetical protein
LLLDEEEEEELVVGGLVVFEWKLLARAREEDSSF